MLFLSWIPVAAATTFAVTRQAALAQSELDTYILGQTSDTAGELQKTTLRFLQENQAIIQSVAMQEETVRFLDGGPEARDRLRQDLESILTEAVNANPALGDVTIYDRRGIVTASHNPDFIGRDDGFRTDIRAALNGEAVTGSIHIGPDDVPGFFISTPVRRGPEVMGVVSARLHADFILSTVSETLDRAEVDSEIVGSFAQDTDVFLVDENGIVLVHIDPDSDWLYRSLGEVDAEALETIRSSAMLGGACPQGTDACAPQEMEPRLPAPIPALAPLDETLEAAFESGRGGTTRYCSPDTVNDPLDETCRSGAWHTLAYEPLHDPTQEQVLFLIVVDVAEEALRSSIRRQATLGIGLVTALFAALVVASIHVARLIARPVHELADVAQSVEEGEPFEPERIAHITRPGDELGHLARVFSDMVVAVQARERKLKEQVRELRIEIDQHKRERRVREIVEDDFFKDLQAKARRIRAEQSRRDESKE
jgi:C4-dicarboxylate-specific signal transduction histidine kinase